MAPPQAVTRHAFYIHGFDPAGPKKYVAMLRNGAKRWAKHAKVELDISEPEEVAEHTMRLVLSASPNEYRPPVRLTLDLLLWDDVVRRHWPETALATRLTVLDGFRRMIAGGTLGWLKDFAWPTLITAALPGAMTTVHLLLLLAGLGVAIAVGAGGLSVGWLAALPLMALVSVGFWWRYEKPNHWAWAGRFISFAWRSVPSDPLREDGRREAFAGRIASAIEDGGADEVVVIGHSGGAQVAAATFADVMRGVPDAPRPLLLTLGSLIPLVSRARGARWLREDLLALGRTAGLRWVDVSSPPDPACVAIIDPVEATFGTAARRHLNGPRTYNARFHANAEKALFKRAKRDRIYMHFLYLRTFPKRERADDFDLYEMLMASGPADSLFEGRPSAPTHFAKGREHMPAPGVTIGADGTVSP